MQAGKVVEVPQEVAGGVHRSRFGVIEKPNQPKNYRFIPDLSSPEGFSVNDSIDPELCSLSYPTLDKTASENVKLGRNARLAKVDIEHAYRSVLVNTDDCPLLGMAWQCRILVGTVLPFGLRSSPQDLFIPGRCAGMDFTEEWGITLIDDFLTISET